MALVVPEGFLFRKDISNVRKFLFSKAKLQSDISLPQGTFLPYTGVKTSILYFTNAHEQNNQKEYWFFDVKNIGETLDNHKRKILGVNDLNKIDSSDIKLVDKQPELKPNMIEIGFRLIDMKHVKKNHYNLVGAAYREINKNNKYPYVALGDKKYFEIVSGGTPDTNNPDYWKDGNLNWATLIDLPDSNIVTRIAETQRKITDKGLKNSSAKLLPVGTIIVSTRATLGRIGIVVENSLATNQGFKNIIVIDQNILPEYVAYAIRAQKEKLEALASGTTFLEISKSNFETIEIPLPPLNVQKQLVESTLQQEREIKILQEKIKANKAHIDRRFHQVGQIDIESVNFDDLEDFNFL
jgi:type I restriction enzyme M protein